MVKLAGVAVISAEVRFCPLVVLRHKNRHAVAVVVGGRHPGFGHGAQIRLFHRRGKFAQAVVGVRVVSLIGVNITVRGVQIRAGPLLRPRPVRRFVAAVQHDFGVNLHHVALQPEPVFDSSLAGLVVKAKLLRYCLNIQQVSLFLERHYLRGILVHIAGLNRVPAEARPGRMPVLGIIVGQPIERNLNLPPQVSIVHHVGAEG